MLGKKLRRNLPLSVLALSFYWSSSISGLKFIPIYEPLTIKAQKNSPPHIAFDEVLEFDRIASEWALIEKIKPLDLAVQKNTAPLFATKMELPEMTFTKSVESVFVAETSGQNSTGDDPSSWMEGLPRTQAVRLQEAQRRSEVLGQDWTVPTWSEMAKEVLEKSGALALDQSASSKVYVAGVNSAGHLQTRIPQARISYPGSSLNDHAKSPVAQEKAPFSPSITPDTNVPDPTANPDENGYSFMGATPERSTAYNIVGPLEITGGLAITNEHHIEIRRSDEGVLKELGKVDLKQGLYNIEVGNTSGTVVARLVDKQGKILGEGSFRLSRLVTDTALSLQGPKLKISPHPDFAGIVTSIYNPRPTDAAPAQTRVTFIKGASEVEVKRDGFVSMDNVTKGSSTVMRVAAPKHLQTASIVISGQEFKSQLFPTSMIHALEDIVGQQRALTFDGVPTIIWGKVSLDGKSLAGIDVVVESDSSLEPIYFNQLMLPDPALKTTTENGLFAFVNVSSGFHSLLATRANSILGYQNVVVEEGSVAQGDIESTIKSDTVPLRVYDAFTGEEQAGTITMQSLQEDVEVKTGVRTVSLPRISRLGMMRTQPLESKYASAHYLYNDTDAFIHVPLVQWSWLNSIKTYLRIDDHPSVGVIVGFVPDEDFEVYLAGYEKFDPHFIVYFDMQGRILQNRKGIAGGGFILYNVPADTHEVVMVGNRTQKIYSRVLPVDVNSLAVLNFR